MFLVQNTQHCWNNFSKTYVLLFIGDLWVSFPYTCLYLPSCFLHIQVSQIQCTLVYTKPKHADPLSMFPAWRQGFSQVILWLCFICMHCFMTSIVFKDSLLSTTVRPALPVSAQLSVSELHHTFRTFCERQIASPVPFPIGKCQRVWAVSLQLLL